MFKDLFNAAHDVAHALAHIAMVPVVAILEGVAAVLSRLLEEAKKI